MNPSLRIAMALAVLVVCCCPSLPAQQPAELPGPVLSPPIAPAERIETGKPVLPADVPPAGSLKMTIVDWRGLAALAESGEVVVSTGDRFYVNVYGAVENDLVSLTLNGQIVGQAIANPLGQVHAMEVCPPVPGRGYRLTAEAGAIGRPVRNSSNLYVRFRQSAFSPPEIVAVQQCRELARPIEAACPMRIESRRFELRVRDDLNPWATYRFVAYFNGEVIASESVVAGKVLAGDGIYRLQTDKGFPPGRYLLTVRIERESGNFSRPASQPVPVDYQPTLLHSMFCGGGADVTDQRCHFK